MHTIPKNVKNCFAVIFSYELSDNLDGYSSMNQDTIDAANLWMVIWDMKNLVMASPMYLFHTGKI